MQKSKIKYTFYNLITSLLGTVITVALGLVIPRLVLVNYGSDTNGMVNSINQFIVYLSLFEAGIGSTALQALYHPVACNDKKSINGILSALNKNYNKIGILYLIVLLGMSFIYPLIVIRDSVAINYITAFGCVLFSGLGNVILFFVQGKYRILLNAEGKSYLMTNLQTIVTILISISKIILINRGFGIFYVIFITFSFNLIQVFYIYYIIKKDYKWIDLSVRPSKMALSQKGYVFIQQIAWMVFQNTDIMLITIFCGLKAVSVYSIYKLVMTNVATLLSIPIDASNFAMGQLYSTDLKKYKKFIDLIEVYYSALYFPIWAAVFCLVLPFIKLYTAGVTDIQYLDPLLPILFVSIELLMLMRKPMINTITYAGHFKSTTPQTIIEMSIQIVVSIVGTMIWGIYGVLIGTIMALFYRFFDVVFYSNHRLLNRNVWKTLFIYGVDIVLFFLCCYIYNAKEPVIDNYFEFFVNGCKYTVLFLMIYCLVIISVFKTERKMVVDIIGNKVN